jgi:hypothetical protein
MTPSWFLIAILDFFLGTLFLLFNMNIFENKFIYEMEKYLSADIWRFFENKKTKTRHLRLCRHFGRFP